jgi:hypothetical protein
MRLCRIVPGRAGACAGDFRVLTHVTERTGSRQILVCTKTPGTYERRLNQYESDVAHLAKLEALEGSVRRVPERGKPVRAKRKKA